jgi:hypothetical protein
MKKLVIMLTICCFSLAITAMTPKPALADDAPVGLILGISAAVGLIAALIIVNSTDKDQAEKLNAEQQARKDMQAKYNSKIGKWTYDDMLSEKGAPTSVVDGDKIKVATYDSTKTSTMGNTVYHKGDFLSEASSDYKASEVKSGEIYTFTFNKKQNTLKSWSYNRITGKGDNAKNDNSFSYNSAENGTAAAEQPAAESATGTLEQKLKDLKDLKDKKLITDEDYKTSKAKLLDNAVK